jgi:hypothetical protein
MAHRATAAMVLAAIFSYGAVARGQTSSCDGIGIIDADQPLRSECPSMVVSSDEELRGAIIGGAVTAGVAYLFASALAALQPQRSPYVDSIPVFGAIWSAAHNEPSDRTQLLIFSAGLQAAGLLITLVTAAELHAPERLRFEVGACATGAGAAVTWRY